jgi:site-specific recombinase XerD
MILDRGDVLTIYRRHYPPCKFAERKEPRRYRTCKCPIWVQGSVGREYVKRALDLRSWQAAADLVRGWEAAGKVGEQRVEAPSILEAVEKFLADARARNLTEATLKKYTRLLEGQFLPFCEARRAVSLSRLTVEFVRDFRDTLDHSPITRLKKLEYLRAFLSFCQASDWIAKNSAKAMKLPKVERMQVKPFTPEEIQKLLDACEKFRGEGNRLRAMILLLRSTGLRVADAVSLGRDRINRGRLFLYTSKTGTPVWCPLPKDVVSALDALPGERFFFWSGNGTLKSALESWRQRLVSLAELAGVKDAHFHRFRHAFSVNLLQRGVPVETVATLLGNTPAIVSKHYSAFVESRQKALEEAVRGAWE